MHLTMSQIKIVAFILLSSFIWCTTARSWGIPNICFQRPPRSEGLCTIEIEGYYYDPLKNHCEKYTVGGCHMIGGQSFGSKQDCLSTCVHGTRRLQDIRQD